MLGRGPDQDKDKRSRKAGVPKNIEARMAAFFRKLNRNYPLVTASIGVIENSVGIDRRTGKTKTISVAEEAARNELGDPATNTPARPFMTLTMEENKDAWDAALAARLKAKMPAEQAVEQIAILARDAVKEKISNYDGPFPNNAPLTVKIKGQDQPLMDMGDLLRSISYEITTGGGEAK